MATQRNTSSARAVDIGPGRGTCLPLWREGQRRQNINGPGPLEIQIGYGKLIFTTTREREIPLLDSET